MISFIFLFKWFGNFVTFSWWDELWLQEALGDYIKYRAVDDEYPGWNVVRIF
jgi:puromycin-sensitive aminopeptidase